MPSKKTNVPISLEQPKSKISVGYIRVSTFEQADESLSLERQETAVRNAGATIVFQDIDSGSKNDRKKLQELMSLVQRRQVAEVIVPRIDRLTRSLRQLLDLISDFEQLQVNLKILDMNVDLRTPTGKVMVMLIGMFAEWETDQLSERGKAEKRQRRQKNLASDTCPFGYKVIGGKYTLDQQPFLCLLTDRPDHYPSGGDADTAEPVPGRTIDQLCRELVELFLEERLPRTTLKQFFEKYGFVKPRYKFNGFDKRLYWSTSGFLGWLTNPVLQGHTPYLKFITVKKRQRELNPNGPEIRYNTHPDQALISQEEAEEIISIIARNRQLGGGNFVVKDMRKKSNLQSEFAYLSGLVYCAQCGSRCTSKTSSKGKYAYFACRHSRVGCNNTKSVAKSTIEQVLIQHLLQASQKLREAAWETKRGLVNTRVILLQASGAGEEKVRQYLLETAPCYEDLDDPFSLSSEQSLRLQDLENQLEDLENVRGAYNPSLEDTKQQIREQIEEIRNTSQSLLDKSAGSLIFEGSTASFWDGLTIQDKIHVFGKIIHKVLINQGKVTEIFLKTEQPLEDKYEKVSGTDYTKG